MGYYKWDDPSRCAGTLEYDPTPGSGSLGPSAQYDCEEPPCYLIGGVWAKDSRRYCCRAHVEAWIRFYARWQRCMPFVGRFRPVVCE